MIAILEITEWLRDSEFFSFLIDITPETNLEHQNSREN